MVGTARMTDGLETARRLVADARAVTVLTGAGISADSGVPTFRGVAGLWRSYRPEDLATPEAFMRDPDLVWAWYRWRRGLVGACAPNDGHRSLARFALSHGSVALVTQNVDGLHQRAAREEAHDRDPAPAIPLELHGSLLRDRCSGCGRRSEAEIPPAELVPPAAEAPRTGDAPSPTGAPRCPACDARLRPDVVWFGETLDPVTLQRAFDAAACDLCLVVGTSSLVHPAASLPTAAIGAGAAVVEVNPEPTPLSGRATLSLRGTAGAILPRLLDPAPPE
jgi:NAD-dependent deacetylase